MNEIFVTVTDLATVEEGVDGESGVVKLEWFGIGMRMEVRRIVVGLEK